jgi:hypothetical protein
MTGDPHMNLWLIGAVFVLLAGLNAPLALVALQLAIYSVRLSVRPDLAWLVGPAMIWIWSAALALQFVADLYFVPATVRDRSYIHPKRFVNAYLHARFQSLLRPSAAALTFAALPLPLPAQSAAVIGFVGGATVYWASAWVREQVAISRGALLLVLLELGKNISGLIITALAGFLPLGALGVIAGLALLAVLWATRLHRERLLYKGYGGQVAAEDS